MTGRHAQLIATAVQDAPAGAVALIEPDAVAVASTADVAATANLMRAFGHALDPDSADAAAVRRYDRAGVTFCPTLDGTMSISGSADPVSGSLLATAVDTAAPLTAGDRRTAARRRLDGLADICRAYLAHPDTGRTGRGGHPHLIVTLDGDTLAADPAASTAAAAAGPVDRDPEHPEPAADPQDTDDLQDAAEDDDAAGAAGDGGCRRGGRGCRRGGWVAGWHVVLDRPDRRSDRPPGRLRRARHLRHHRPRRQS